MAASAAARPLPPDDPSSSRPERDAGMGFLEHLEELRRRIVRSCIAIAVGMLIARNVKYAILLIFIIAAVLTPSADPWNQTVFAAPMIGLYLLSIAIAWIVAPRSQS